jgi:DNA modification methylase
MGYQLHLGDCLEIMPTLADNSIDLLFTSPPYFNAREYIAFVSYAEYLDFIERFVEQAKRLIKPDRILIINVSCVIEAREKRSMESTRLPIPFDCAQIAMGAGFKFIDDIIWQKPDGAAALRGLQFSQSRRPLAYKPFGVTEYLLVFKNGDGLLDKVIRSHPQETINSSLVNGGYERTNVWKIQPVTNSEHPAAFPLALADKVIRYYSYVGNTVLDPFLGSGTTGVACMNTNRNFIGIEKDVGYFEIAKRRIENAQPALMEVA